MNPLTATVVRGRVVLAGALVLIALALWSARHATAMVDWMDGGGTRFTVVFALAFVMLSWQTTLSYLERPRRATSRQQHQLDELYVVVSVPVYNEDPAALKAGLRSLLEQTRRPNLIYVVDDGSTAVDYTEVVDWLAPRAEARGVAWRWVRKPNGGKRSAQGRAFADTPHADVYLTVDSDAVLAPNAIREGLMPFADPEVQSVAGVVVALNVSRNWLTRLTDLWFVVGQLTDRSAMSTMGSVLVNSGPLALYRAGLVRDNLHGYLNETFFGRRVEFSDDSMLTIYALARGKAVQQPTAIAFTLMPEKVSHHIRQWMRWMRGAFIRSWWRFRYLPGRSYAFWGHLMGWVQMVLGTAMFIALFVVQPFHDWRVVPYYLVVPVLIGYGQALRYLTLRRSDQKLASQLLTVAAAPLATLWAFFLLRPLRWWAMLTPLRTGWGTRQAGVEVALRPAAAGAA